MHELAVCEELLGQVRATARAHGAKGVGRITVVVGPLSGVEPDLLDRAFAIARAGEYTAEASLVIETAAIRVRCRGCGEETAARPNRLVCGACGDFHVDLVGGDELLLARIELEGVDRRGESATNEHASGERTHV